LIFVEKQIENLPLAIKIVLLKRGIPYHESGENMCTLPPLIRSLRETRAATVRTVLDNGESFLEKRLMDITTEDFNRIAALIHDADSPVGIDAKKTHVLIIRKLEDIERRLERIEAKLSAGD
jgi:hypothetical protein